MPAKSKPQQRLFGMVRAHQKAEPSHPPAIVKSVASSIKPPGASNLASNFARTKHDKLPNKKDDRERKEKKAHSELAKTRHLSTLYAARGKVDSGGVLGTVYPNRVPKQAGFIDLGALGRPGLSAVTGCESSDSNLASVPASPNKRQILDSTRLKAAGVIRDFFPFLLPDGSKLEGRDKTAAVPGMQPPMSPNMQSPQSSSFAMPQAMAGMQQFLQPPSGKPQMAGFGPMQIGLPAGGQKAPSFPGAGSAIAANPIDSNGGLDPVNNTIDGNHATGVAKGFKVASWSQDKTVESELREVVASQHPTLPTEGVMGLLTSLGMTTGRDGERLLSTMRDKQASQGSCESSDSTVFVASTLLNASQLREKISGCETSHSSQAPAKSLCGSSQLFEKLAAPKPGTPQYEALVRAHDARNQATRDRDILNDDGATPPWTVGNKPSPDQMGGAYQSAAAARAAAAGIGSPAAPSPTATAKSTRRGKGRGKGGGRGGRGRSRPSQVAGSGSGTTSPGSGAASKPSNITGPTPTIASSGGPAPVKPPAAQQPAPPLAALLGGAAPNTLGQAGNIVNAAKAPSQMGQAGNIVNAAKAPSQMGQAGNIVSSAKAPGTLGQAGNIANAASAPSPLGQAGSMVNSATPLPSPAGMAGAASMTQPSTTGGAPQRKPAAPMASLPGEVRPAPVGPQRQPAPQIASLPDEVKPAPAGPVRQSSPIAGLPDEVQPIQAPGREPVSPTFQANRPPTPTAPGAAARRGAPTPGAGAVGAAPTPGMSRAPAGPAAPPASPSFGSQMAQHYQGGATPQPMFGGGKPPALGGAMDLLSGAAPTGTPPKPTVGAPVPPPGGPSTATPPMPPTAKPGGLGASAAALTPKPPGMTTPPPTPNKPPLTGFSAAQPDQGLEKLIGKPGGA